jgi:1-acyl-sn-glycerol-3-phosphate acyltransferase
MQQRSFGKRLWYDFTWLLCRILGVAFFRIRVRGREQVPAQGGALILSNHQSHMDPVLIGLACDRRLNFLARQSLFRFSLLRRLIESLDAIPIDREGVGLAGLKETLRRLRRGEIVLIFPEGTRTLDGEVASLKPGFCALARRADVPLVPVAIAGAFAALPRWRTIPHPTPIHVEFGKPLTPAEIENLDDVRLVAEVEARIRECHRRAADFRQCTTGVAPHRPAEVLPKRVGQEKSSLTAAGAPR